MFKCRSERSYYLIQIVFFLIFSSSLYALGSFVLVDTWIFKCIPVMNQATLFYDVSQWIEWRVIYLFDVLIRVVGSWF